MTATPSRRPSLSRLTIAPASVSTIACSRIGGVNSSPIRVSVAPAALPMPSEVAGLAAHGDDEIPPRRRLGVDHQVLDDLDAVMPRRLEPERVDVDGQIEIVVDRLRDVHDADPARRLPVERHRRIRGVIAADRQQTRDVEAEERSNGVLEVVRVGVGIGARDADVRSAAEVDPAHCFDRERHDVIDVALHDPLEAVADAEDVDALEPGPNRRRADDAVDAWGRPAPDENGQRMLMLH
jgi:hypothetical protein